MPPIAPPERDLDDEVSDVVEAVEDVAEEPPAVGVLSAPVVGIAVVVVDGDVDNDVDEGVDEDVDKDALEVASMVVLDEAINAVGSNAQVVASGSAELRELNVLLREVTPRSRRISCCLLQQMLICPADPVQLSLIATTLAKSLAAGCGGGLTYH